jgi:hypothetical protein
MDLVQQETLLPMLNPNAASFIPTANCDREQHNDSLAHLTKAFTEQIYMSRLPAPEPSVFNGDPIQFPGWLTAFKLLIETPKIMSTLP